MSTNKLEEFEIGGVERLVEWGGWWSGEIGGVGRLVEWGGRWSGEVGEVRRLVEWEGRWRGEVAGVGRSEEWGDWWSTNSFRSLTYVVALQCIVEHISVEYQLEQLLGVRVQCTWLHFLRRPTLGLDRTDIHLLLLVLIRHL